MKPIRARGSGLRQPDRQLTVPWFGDEVQALMDGQVRQQLKVGPDNMQPGKLTLRS